MRDRRAWSLASKLRRIVELAETASWYASRASFRRCTCSMKAVADLVNLSIASVYIAMVGVGCELMASAFFHVVSFHIASLLLTPQLLVGIVTHYKLAREECSNCITDR